MQLPGQQATNLGVHIWRQGEVEEAASGMEWLGFPV